MTDKEQPRQDLFVRVALLTMYGEYVTTAVIPPYNKPPDVLIWGQRVFKVSVNHPDIYNECYSIAVTRTEDRSQLVPSQMPENYKIVINGREVTITDPEVSYAFLINLAFPEAPTKSGFTVTFKDALQPIANGTLGEGQAVALRREGTIFNVVIT